MPLASALADGDGGGLLPGRHRRHNNVEQELREDNNVHVGGLLGVGSRTDLVVSG